MSETQDLSYRLLFETSTEGLLLVDAGEILMDANFEACNILGYEKEELLKLGLRDVIDTSDPRAEDLFKRYRTEKQCRCQLRLLRRGGSTFAATVSAVKSVDTNGGPVFCLALRERDRDEGASPGEALSKDDSDLIVLCDADNTVRYNSPSVRRILDYKPDELLGVSISSVIHPDDLGSVIGEGERTAQESVRRASPVRYRHKDGSWVYLESTTDNLLDVPGIRGTVVTAREMTVRRRAEEKSYSYDDLERQVELRTAQLNAALADADDSAELLRLSEERFRTLVRHASDTIIVLDTEGKILYESPAVERVLGFKPEQRIGTNAFDYLHPEDVETVRNRFSEVLEKPDERFTVEYRVLDKDGSWRYVEAIGTNVLDNPVIGGIIINARDITTRRRAEEELRQSEERFRLLVEGVEDYAIFMLDPDGRVTTWNEGAERTMGYRTAEIIGEHFSVFYTEEDVERGHPEEELAVAIREGCYEEEGLRVRKDGSRFWADVVITPLRDEKGNLRGFSKRVRNIEERRQAQQELRQRENLYRSVIEQAAENIFIVDIETKRILEANAALSQSLGYASDELKQMTLYEIVAHTQESVDLDVQHTMKEGRHFTGERQYRRKDGTLAYVEMSVSTVSYGSRGAMCIVARDITERKRAEGDLRRNLSVLLALREAGQVLGSTLESEEIISRLLEIMRRVSSLTAAVISVQDNGRLRIRRSAGLKELWDRARFAPEAEETRWAVLRDEEQRLIRLRHPDSSTESLVALYLPLKSKDRVVGVLEAYGPEALADNDAVEILSSLASQAASALENARLYEELEERERKLQDLVGKLLGAQEEERRRVAYEVHDELAQVAVAAHQHLQAFADRHAPNAERGRRDLDRILRLVRETVLGARQIISNLRPTALDDLGLAAAISLEVERLREEGYHVEYRDDLGDERLPDVVEIALFRIAREALTNMRKHAQTKRVHVELRQLEDEVYLEVRDYGRGFDPIKASMESGPGERVGLAGMRERVGMLGGELEIHSQPGSGTSVKTTIPLVRTP